MLSYLFQNRRLHREQSGATSIYISLLIMFILTLIAVAFADLTRKNLIDISQNQLNLQAHYAAESAVNDVRAGLHQQLNKARQSSDVGSGISVDIPTNGFLSSPADPGARFGSAIAVSNHLLAVGAPSQNSQGAVYVFKKTPASAPYTSWLGDTPTRVLHPGSSEFGAAVALDGGLLAVGDPSANAVHIFTVAGDQWTRENTLMRSNMPGFSGASRFGSSLFIEGNMLLVGAPDEGSGAVYHFTRKGSTFDYDLSWRIASSSISGINHHSVNLPTGVTKFGATMGFSVGKLAIGTSGGQGRLYVLQRVNVQGGDDKWASAADEIYNQPGSADQTANDVDADLGGDVALERTLMAAATPTADGNAGAVELLRLEANSWQWQHRISSATPPPGGDTSQTQINVNAGDLFGTALALDGDFLIAGVPGHSSQTGGLWFIQVENNDILGDVWSFGSDFNCPDEEDAHPSWSNGRLAGDDSVEYSCVIVDVSPVDLIYDNVDTNRSLILPLKAVDADNNHLNLNKLVIEWDNTDSQTVGRPRPQGINALTDRGGWQDTGGSRSDLALLRLQVIPVNTSRGFDRNTLNTNSKVFFLYPNQGADAAGAGVHDYQTENSGSILAGNCLTGSKGNTDVVNRDNQLLTCRVVLDNLPSPSEIHPTGQTTGDIVYVIRLQAVYNPARLLITGDAGSNAGQPLLEGFSDIQAVITATGRAINVFERLEERIPLRPVFDLPEYGIDSEETICKLLASDSGERGAHISLNEEQRNYYGDRGIHNNLGGQYTNCWINIHGSSPKADWTTTP